MILHEKVEHCSGREGVILLGCSFHSKRGHNNIINSTYYTTRFRIRSNRPLFVQMEVGEASLWAGSANGLHQSRPCGAKDETYQALIEGKRLKLYCDTAKLWREHHEDVSEKNFSSASHALKAG